MDIEIEDGVFLLSVLGIFALFLYLKSVLGFGVPSLTILWIGLSLLIAGHTYIYIKKKRDMKIEKIRYIFSIVPMYLILIYLTYQELLDHDRLKNENIIIFGVVFLIIILNGIAEYFLTRKK